MTNFSIVITTYNRLDFLKKAIKSALEQSYPGEVIIVDDCSSDQTEEYVKSLGNQVIYLRNEQNLGHSASVNKGVEIATGNWIKLLDDDDYLDVNCLEKMREAIAPYPEAVICSCQAIQVNDQGQKLKTTNPVGKSTIYHVLQEDIHYQMLMENLPFGTPVQVAFQKAAFLTSGGWDSYFDSNYDDIYAWIKIAKYGDAIFINQPLTYRTIWSGGTAINLSLEARLQKNIEIKRTLYQLVNPKYQSELPSLDTFINFLRLYWGLIGLKHGQINPSLKMIFPAALSWDCLIHFIQLVYRRKLKKIG